MFSESYAELKTRFGSDQIFVINSLFVFATNKTEKNNNAAMLRRDDYDDEDDHHHHHNNQVLIAQIII